MDIKVKKKNLFSCIKKKMIKLVFVVDYHYQGYGFSFRCEYFHNTNTMLNTIEAGVQTETALAGGAVVSALL